MLMLVLSFKNKDIDMEMILPSKELLEKVLDVEIIYDHLLSIKENELKYYVEKDGDFYECLEINIYELMHLMKDWAWGNGYILTSKKSFFGEWSCRIHKKLESESFTPKLIDVVLSDFETDTVTKACEWVLKETNA